jgi:DNA-binding MarR family transcriptional regulator
MSTTLSPQLIGQTEKTLNAILYRHLADAGLDEPQWVTLTLAVVGGGPTGRDEFARHVASAAKFDEGDVHKRIDQLVAAGLLDVTDGGDAQVTVTDAGSELHARIRAVNTQLTERLWGDLPAEDRETAARVLGIVLQRANAELGA